MVGYELYDYSDACPLCRSDREVNNRCCSILSEGGLETYFIRWRDVRVGDVIYLKNDEVCVWDASVPCSKVVEWFYVNWKYTHETGCIFHSWRAVGVMRIWSVGPYPPTRRPGSFMSGKLERKSELPRLRYVPLFSRKEGKYIAGWATVNSAVEGKGWRRVSKKLPWHRLQTIPADVLLLWSSGNGVCFVEVCAARLPVFATVQFDSDLGWQMSNSK